MPSSGIVKTPSPNFNDRKQDVTMLVMHYTGMQTMQIALDRMTDPTSEVSAHYMIDTDGTIYQLVDESKRAWHAGHAFWRGIQDGNSASIGIEIVNPGHDWGYTSFPEQQIRSVTKLSQDILTRHAIPNYNVVGHSDIAPDRKIDPGELFPWQELAQNGIGTYPDQDIKVNPEITAKSPQQLLELIGYNLRIEQSTLIKAFQRRFRPQKIDGIIDDQTRQILEKMAT